jgi:uncharacterized protein YhdP
MLFNYHTGWPMLSHLNARALFDGRSLQVAASPGAQILGAEAGDITANIPDLAHAVLTVQGKMDTDMQMGLHFIAESPLQKTIGEGLDQLKLQGEMVLDLSLHIPLHKGDDMLKVQGDVRVAPGGELAVPAWKAQLSDFSGAFRFTENSLSAEKLTARWLGQPVTIGINTQTAPNNTHTIVALLKGRTTIDTIAKAYDLRALKNKVSGEADYQAQLTLNRADGHPYLLFGIDSDLQGIALDLPEPFKKAAAEKNPVHVDIQPQEKSALRVGVDYAKKLAANLDFSQNAQKTWAFQQAVVQVSAQMPTVFGMALSGARIQVQPTVHSWSVQINSQSVQGQLKIPRDFSSLLWGYFQRFRLVPSPDTNVPKPETVNPGDIPPLDLEFKDFYYGDRHLGALSLLTSSGKNVLQIRRLNVVSGDTTLSAQGLWQQTDAGRQQTTLNGDLKSGNLGAALDMWQVTSSLSGGQGSSTFALSCAASPQNFSVGQLSGSFSLLFNKGRILNISDSKAAEMGIGRILNLLSLQSIPRRLSLDFSDLVQKGFPFDVMKGDFRMKNGQVFTDEAYLNGPIAKVTMRGRIGLAARDYDVWMMTTPYLTSSLPVAATIVGGPIAGAAAWAGSKLLSPVVNRITTHTYRVTGSWDQPLMEAAK